MEEKSEKVFAEKAVVFNNLKDIIKTYSEWMGDLQFGKLPKSFKVPKKYKKKEVIDLSSQIGHVVSMEFLQVLMVVANELEESDTSWQQKFEILRGDIAMMLHGAKEGFRIKHDPAGKFKPKTDIMDVEEDSRKWSYQVFDKFEGEEEKTLQ